MDEESALILLERVSESQRLASRELKEINDKQKYGKRKSNTEESEDVGEKRKRKK